MNKTATNETVSGAYLVNINGNKGFMCDRSGMMTPHTANLICQSLGLSKADGWFKKGKYSINFRENIIFP